MPVRFGRYLIAGGFSAALEWGTFLLLYYVWNWSVVWANTISFSIVLLINFILTKFWVFPGRHRHSTSLQAVMYLGLALFNVAVSNIIVANLSQLVPAGLAKLMTMAAVVSWNFVLMRLRIFGTVTESDKGATNAETLDRRPGL
jgi:putative flippase GtrA